MPWVWEQNGVYWWPGTRELRALPMGTPFWGQWWILWIVGKHGEWEIFKEWFVWEDGEWPEN